jgi:hypothetical protein
VPGAPGAFSINLASERVRRAMHLLEGLRNGQSLGALLGYRLERALHDAGGIVELDVLIFAFRRAFPLTAGKLAPTAALSPPADEAIEARNVPDGLALVRRAAVSATASYPYGADLPVLGAAERAVVEKAVRDAADICDALADLMLAEAVHQAAQGGTDRVAAQLEVASDFTARPSRAWCGPRKRASPSPAASGSSSMPRPRRPPGRRRARSPSRRSPLAVRGAAASGGHRMPRDLDSGRRPRAGAHHHPR